MLDLHEYVERIYIAKPYDAPYRSIKWARCGQMSGEEVPFKSMKITLSEDAIDKLGELVKMGSFRSYSSAVEECIRAVYDVSLDMGILFKSTQGQILPPNAQQEAFRRYFLRLTRFIAPLIQQK